jgi:hypothetical protein
MVTKYIKHLLSDVVLGNQGIPGLSTPGLCLVWCRSEDPRCGHPVNTPQTRLDMNKYWRIGVMLKGGGMMIKQKKSLPDLLGGGPANPPSWPQTGAGRPHSDASG